MMALPRIFIAAALKPKQEITLDIKLSNYILQVLRLKIKDGLIIFNDSGGEFLAVLTAINKRCAVVIVEKFVQCNNESPLQIHLGQGISRGEKMDFTVQKAVELGANTITPLFTEYCGIKLKDERLENRLRHWQEVAVSAAGQSGRCYVPKILPAKTLVDWAAITTGVCLVLDPAASNKLADIKEQPRSVTILIGPEGGLSDKEIICAKQNNFLPIKLGPRILRTETAALTAISILQAKWGDF
jgi:16S rRNA (uracil1498-N3)-methyltransferase